jgi:hypothetical protein
LTSNNVNEITSQSGGTNRTLTYDLNGSITSVGGTRTIEWDGANWLAVGLRDLVCVRHSLAAPGALLLKSQTTAAIACYLMLFSLSSDRCREVFSLPLTRSD